MDNIFLKVDGIRDGLLKEWNIENPTQAVKVGDLIARVNGQEGNINNLLQKTQDQEIDITFKRLTGSLVWR